MKLIADACKILLLSCAAVGLYAQPPVTQIQDTLYDQQRNPYSGAVSITPSIRSGTVDGVSVVMSAAKLRVTNGVLSIALVPNTILTPANSTYAIRYGNGGVKTCTIPVSATPITLANYCSDNPSPILAGDVPLAFLRVPAGTPAGQYCLNVSSTGAVTITTSGCPGSGGGVLLLSTLTDGQLLTLSNGQLLTLQN